MASNITGSVAVDSRCCKEQSGFLSPNLRSLRSGGSNRRSHKNQLELLRKGHIFRILPFSLPDCPRCINEIRYPFSQGRQHVVSCHSSRASSQEDKMCSSKECYSNIFSCHTEEQKDEGCDTQFCGQLSSCRVYHPNQGLAEACKFVFNDAKFVNERARNDIILLSRGLTRLNDRARQDVAVLGIGFLKLDARAREDTEKIDTHMRKKAARLHHLATIIKDKARTKLKNAADQHWSDGALEADLKRADSVAKRRAMEDAFMALKFVKSIHDIMANKLYLQPHKEGALSINDMMGIITLERNGKIVDLFGGVLPTDRIIAIQEACQEMAFALSEADGIDYTDPEELELLVATLIDLDAIDSKSSLSLLAECSTSPDVSTRKALANALASAPSMWLLGNAGMGALQRLAEDPNPAVAAAASEGINELKQQWEVEGGGSLRFIMNQHLHTADDDDDDDDDVSPEE